MSTKYDFLCKRPKNVGKGEYHHNKNIVRAGEKIFKKLEKYDEVVCCAEMQSGKTDVMKRLIYVIGNYGEKLKKMGIDIVEYNVYVVLCTSSINLKKQLQAKLPEIHNKVYHLNNIQTIVKNTWENSYLLTTMADSSLIIFDECHCDVEHKKLIDKYRSLLEYTAKKNNTFFHKIGFSASPYEQIVAKYPKVIMKPAKEYFGICQMFDSSNTDRPMIFQAKKLYKLRECKALLKEIDIGNFYYIFRLPGIKNLEHDMMLNLEKEFSSVSKFDSYIYDMSYRGNINDLLSERPKKPTIIYLKDKLRMGEYLDTKYVHIAHDNPKSNHTHTTAQSLLGRCCGYNKKKHHTIIYCDIEKAKQHYEWVKNKYSIEYVPRDAKYVKVSKETRSNCIY